MAEELTLPELKFEKEISPEPKPSVKKIKKSSSSKKRMRKKIEKISHKKEEEKDEKKESKNILEIKRGKKPSKKPMKTRTIHPHKVMKSEHEIALDFASKIQNKFSNIIKATVLFGSQVKRQEKSSSDIDIIIIIDDAFIDWDIELIAWYREELAKLISVQNYSKDLHINTIKLTTWWNDLMHGDPVIINIIRYGEVLIDSGGFFNPLKSLLAQGKIHATPEAVYTALRRSPLHLARSKFSIINSIEGVYWSMVDAAQAALITLGKLPPSPEHITGMLKVNFVDTKILDLDYVKWYRDIYTLHKSISHRQIHYVKGAEIDEWQEKAEKFLKKMTDIIDKMIDASRK